MAWFPSAAYSELYVADLPHILIYYYKWISVYHAWSSRNIYASPPQLLWEDDFTSWHTP